MGQLDLILFLGFLGLWKFEKEEWEKGLGLRHLKIFVAEVNRILETRFICDRHVEKVPIQTRSEYENRLSNIRFIVQNRSS